MYQLPLALYYLIYRLPSSVRPPHLLWNPLALYSHIYQLSNFFYTSSLFFNTWTFLTSDWCSFDLPDLYLPLTSSFQFRLISAAVLVMSLTQMSMSRARLGVMMQPSSESILSGSATAVKTENTTDLKSVINLK